MGIWCVLCNSLSQITDDGGVCVEEIITGHSRLAGDTGRDDDNLDALECLCELFLWEAYYFAGGVDMADVCCDTGCTTDIVQAQ